jgi:hypothetical protein
VPDFLPRGESPRLAALSQVQFEHETRLSRIACVLVHSEQHDRGVLG